MEGLGVVLALGTTDSACRRMADNTELVSLRVSEVRAIVVLVILRPQARRSLRCAAVGKGDIESLIDDGSTLREERDHLTVARLVRLPIDGPADEKERPRARLRLPARPRTTVLTEAGFDAESSHQRAVESERTVEVFDADEDV